MKRIIQLFLLFFTLFGWSQNDFSGSWEDFYSYNNVKDFVMYDDEIFAISDNAFFKYNLTNDSVVKISSINGLSGETTSSICYSKTYLKTFIGYETGLIEIIDKNGNISLLKDIENFNYTGDKSINDIVEYNNKLYISTSFAIVVYDLSKQQFGDTFFIGDESTEVLINKIKIFDNKIYAATENGIYVADADNLNLIDFNNWTHYFTGNFVSIEVFNNQIYTIKDKTLYRLENNLLVTVKTYSQSLLSLKSSTDYLTISTLRIIYINKTDNSQYTSYTTVSTNPYYFSTNTALFDNNTLYIATTEYGILKSEFETIGDFKEIHPDGPLSNSPFSISVKDANLWVVYGGYSTSYSPSNGKYGVSHFNANNWVNIPYSNFNVKNLVNVTFDINNSNKVYISSYAASSPTDITNTGGMLIMENDEMTDFWNYSNSGLENLVYTANPNYISTRIGGSAFDSQGNLWIANSWVNEPIKKYSSNGVWSSFDMTSIASYGGYGLNELIVDSFNNVWIGSRQDGVLVFNESSNNKTALTTDSYLGALPSLNVRTIQMDASNRLWIGTYGGLVVLYNAINVFSSSSVIAESVIILEDNVAQKLLGDAVINSIAIDGADNKWFGTDSGGVLQTNPDGSTTLQTFNTDNSPLPSDKILKIAVDKNSGKVYFATDKGIVAYNSNVATYGDELPEVYAYPNPSTKNNSLITIDGRNGAHLPNKTNVKILDTAGNLVYETNVKEGEELYGGKVVWDKTNLAGKKVASGVYIVLLTSNESSETAITKIAIIN